MTSDAYHRIRRRLPNPVGAQASVVALRPLGHYVILGTAGSGKTLMALLRAMYLSYPGTAHAGRTLLATYNKSLLAYMRSVVNEDLDELDVVNYHHFARGYLASLDLLPAASVMDDGPRETLIMRAVAELRAAGELALDRGAAFFVEELTWISELGYNDEESYLQAERTGRRTPLPRQGRMSVWAVRSKYLALRRQAGRLYDWRDIASTVRGALATDSRQRRYRHVVIDEGQDFSPEMIRSLVEAIPEEGSLTLFADAAQQIYVQGILSWREAGLHVTKIWEFRKNPDLGGAERRPGPRQEADSGRGRG